MTDARGLETSITDYAGGTIAGIQRTYEYDWEGNVTKEKELEGNYKTFTYDSKGRNTVVKYHKADGTETLKTAYTYDVNDQVTLMEDFEKKNGSWELYRSTKYTYDALKRMSSYTEWDGEGAAPAEPTVSYTYDIEGNVTAVDYAGTGSELTGLTFEYDSSRKLTKIKAKTGGLLSDTVREYSYDDQGRVSTIRDHYAFTGSGSYLERSYTYDDFGRVTSMTYDENGNGGTKEYYEYGYDKNNNITYEHILNGYGSDNTFGDRYVEKQYYYDARGQLTETQVSGGGRQYTIYYTYDDAGNRISENLAGTLTEYQYNGLDQLTESICGNISKTYEYDRNGNQISEMSCEQGTEKAQRLFDYDEADRLKTLIKKDEGNITLIQENHYNGSGQRIERKETRPGAEPDKYQVETDYFYQDGAVLYTKDADGNRSSMNLLGISANVIATSRGTGDSESWYLHNKDIRESTTSITGADGTAAATYEYDDFGNTMVTSGRSFDNEICYTGQIYDQSSGLYYYNARFYDPENARFLTQDTYRGENDQPDTLHLYAYCANNPINYTDPSGHFVMALPVIGVGVLIKVAILAAVTITVGGLVYTVAVKATEWIKKNNKRQKNYYKAYYSSKHKEIYIAKSNPISRKSAGGRIKNGKSVYTYTKTLAKKAMITAGKGWVGPEIDKKKKSNIGKPLYYHYHTKNRNGAHMWYGMPKVYKK